MAILLIAPPLRLEADLEPLRQPLIGVFSDILFSHVRPIRVPTFGHFDSKDEAEKEELKFPVTIDVVVPLLEFDRQAARANTFSPMSTLVGKLYRLTSDLMAEVGLPVAEDITVVTDEGGKITVTGPASVDVRVLLASTDQEAGPATLDVVQPLERILAADRPWDKLHVLRPDGDTIDSSSLTVATTRALMHRASAGKSSLVPTYWPVSGWDCPAQASKPPSSASTDRHSGVAVGGTFDHLHVGHKVLLTMALFESDPGNGTIVVGITNDALLEKKTGREKMQSWAVREQLVRRFILAVADFSAAVSVSERIEDGLKIVEMEAGKLVRLAEIADPCGPTATDGTLTALVVSAETFAGSKIVNATRADRGLGEMAVFEINLVEQGGIKISSTEIRQRLAGQI